MKTKMQNFLVLTLLVILLILPKIAPADPGSQYCVTPAFVTSGILPNLLMMVDNSASMFDLAHVDKGCSTCTPVRNAKYCYDNTYKDTNTYAGYFDKDAYYDYNIADTMANSRFVKISTFPAAADCSAMYLTNKLCVATDTSTPPRITKVSAVGNYLNWLTASKFDVEKKILTGGKWANPDLIGESRGCVGRGFLKQPLSSNNGNYDEGGTNTAFPISLQIKGESSSWDATAPSQGGQTSIFFYKGTSAVDYAKCDEAINLLETTNSISNEVKTAVADCIGATTDTSLAGKSKQIFQQSLQECWQYFKNDPDSIQGNDYLNVKNFCTDVYNLRDPGKASTNPAADIKVGDAALLCSDNYVGACYGGVVASSSSPAASLLALLGPKEAFAASATTPGTVQFKSATYSVNENGGTVTLLVSRTGGKDGAIDVSYATANGTATSGADYVAKSGTLSWNNNNADDKSIVITITDDAFVEVAETFTVSLSNPKLGNVANAAVLGATAASTVTIIDNDATNDPGTISFETAAPGAVNEGAGSITLLVKRLGGAYGAATVNYTTANDTALAGSDYTTTSGTLTWADGNSDTKTIIIPIIKESPNVVETNESFTVTLSGATGAALGTPSVSTVTITETTASAGLWPNSWTSDACVKSQHEKYCGGLKLPPVTDPTDVKLDETNNYANLPAVIADVAIAGQMGAPLKLVSSSGVLYDDAKVKVSTKEVSGAVVEPQGLIQKFASKMRIGLMSFNSNGSPSECAAGSSIPCPKVCSNDSAKTCTTALDCCAPGDSCACNDAAANISNADGAKIIYQVGLGKCEFDPGVECTTKDNCPAHTPASKCVLNGAGSHTSGLVGSLDGLKASSWTPFSEGFYDAIGYFAHTGPTVSRTALRINPVDATNPTHPVDFPATMNPSQFSCQQNNVLLISDGVSTADQRPAVMGLADLYKTAAGLSGGACTDYKGSSNLPILTWLARKRNISDFSTAAPISTTEPTQKRDWITTYAVFNGQGTGSGECNSDTLLNNAATKGGGKYYHPESYDDLEENLKSALDDMSSKAASGTAASILSNSEGSGANILQAVFYPKKVFDNASEVIWVGEMQNLWYYVDPLINNSTIREDTDKNFSLHTVNDYVLRFAFDPTSDKTMVQRFKDDNGDGAGDTPEGVPIDPDNINSLWRAGKSLWERDINSVPRKIKTSTNGNSLIDFSSATRPGGTVASNATLLAPYLNVAEAAAPGLINWVHGEDSTVYRPRLAQIKNSSNVLIDGTWRLGDIISSTPRVQSTVRLNTYNLPPPGGYSDKSYETYINSNEYQSRGMVYVGGNDGLFHAFNLGLLSVKATGFQKATLTPNGVMGKEEWAYIPKNTLPYLKYIADPAYGHIYSIDGRTSIFDASIGYTGDGTCVRTTYYTCEKDRNSSVVDSNNNLLAGTNTWRTVVIGGMGIGGASAKTCAANTNCVATPITDPGDTTNNPGLGYSSYFAFDVSDPPNPVLLWEYNNTALGYATSGPAIVRIGDPNKNGRWYAVFGSGPTGPINTDTNQFIGNSDQNLKFFVVDIQTGVEVGVIDTGIANAFAGPMLGGSIDTDRAAPSVLGNYQDDAIYVGYTKKNTGVTPNNWTQGGVGRIITKESTNVNDWVWSKIVDDIGPVTTAISRLQDKKNRNLWLFFGTGRYFFRDVNSLDDLSGARSLFGIKEPCYNTATVPGNFLDSTCSAAISGSVVDQTSSISTIAAGDPGWKIDLEAGTTTEGAERVVTDTVALTNGTVFFTSFKPTMDLCGFGGNSFLWGVKYDTGGQAAANALMGKALIQLSTGEFKEVDLGSAFTDKLNRRMQTPMTGKPPSDAPPIISNSANKPVKKILHIQEH